MPILHRTRLDAKVVPYSSVVGQSVMLTDDNGYVVCQLSIVGASVPLSRRFCQELADKVAELINSDGHVYTLGD